MQLSDFDASNNLVSLFLARADAQADRPFLWDKHDGAWRSLSWAEAARQVCQVAESLRRLGLKGGDRVMLVSENRPEWCLADLGIMAAGCVTVPAYTTNTERDHLHVLENSGARAVIVSDAKLAKPLLPAVLRSDIAAHVISFESLRQHQAGDTAFHDWDDPARRRRRGRAQEGRRPDFANRPRGHGLHHLHQRHRREPARGDAAPRHDPAERRWRSPDHRRGFRLGGRGFPVVPAAQPRLRTYRRPVPADRPGRARSITPRVWKSLPAISRKCARPSWSWCRACSRCCARGS